MDALLENFTHDLDAESNKIMTRINQIIDLLNYDAFDEALSQDLVEILGPYIAKNWEHEQREMDLHEQVRLLRQQLRESMRLEDWDSPAAGRTRTALEAAQTREIETLREQITVLEARVVELEAQPWMQKVTGKWIEVSSANWELMYKCRDLSGEVSGLHEQLRQSVAVEDLRGPGLKPKTALERVLEKKVDGLVKKTGRPRTKTM
ncbi:hypothetical protein DL765_007098 [Monosporascus sp. GIB2]|nr:hypothetical protein DL765_007098 [Monosporascus sp. GIB2]